MRTITNIEKIELKLSAEETLNCEWVSVSLVSDKLNTIENCDRLGYKALRGKFYNSLNSDKYNTKVISGVKWINIKDPMKAPASLQLKFELK